MSFAHDPETDRWFNKGCEARLAGRSVRDHPPGLPPNHLRAFRDGWRDVDNFWAIRAGGRPVMPLPMVQSKRRERS
jgi:hypothetical protein